MITFGPRTTTANQRFIDASCTWGTTEYPQDNYTASAEWVTNAFAAVGYLPSQITTEDNGALGPNVVVTKIGTTYPDTFIDFTAHLDTVSSSPGANDNGAGVAAVIEIARVP